MIWHKNFSFHRLNRNNWVALRHSFLGPKDKSTRFGLLVTIRIAQNGLRMKLKIYSDWQHMHTILNGHEMWFSCFQLSFGEMTISPFFHCGAFQIFEFNSRSCSRMNFQHIYFIRNADSRSHNMSFHFSYLFVVVVIRIVVVVAFHSRGIRDCINTLNAMSVKTTDTVILIDLHENGFHFHKNHPIRILLGSLETVRVQLFISGEKNH